jgi:LysR family transcriptional activator of nhaA
MLDFSEVSSTMRPLNYNHLHYFWTVAREGSVAVAAERLHLTPQTISGQLRILEQSLGVELFQKVGRRLQLTPAGELAFRYADDMFSLGEELQRALQEGTDAELRPLVVGIVDVLPKLISQRLLAPALALAEPVRLVCREGKLEVLMGQLITHQVDLVLADRPIGSATAIKAFSHPLADSGVSFFASRSLADRLPPQFPQSLDGAPMLLPAPDTYSRRLLELWFDETGIHPRVVGEFDDSALLRAFGQHGAGVFPAPSAIEAEICQQHDVQVLGSTAAVRERYYAILVERKLTHPAVQAILDAAATSLRAEPQPQAGTQQ